MISSRRGMILSLSICVFVLAACGNSGSDESEPTFEQAQVIAKKQLAGEPCKFQVDEESSDNLEQSTLGCLTTVQGEQRLTTVFTYEKVLEESEFDLGGITTGDSYFENGNITVEPAGGDPTAIQLDAEEFTTALKEECGCGEVLTPE